jgi:ribosomal-protein-alanine N-acetyltransferase
MIHSETCTIESATCEDLEEIFAIEVVSFTAPWTRHMFEVELVGNPFARTLVGRSVDRRVVGYICAWVVFDEVRIMTLAVHPDWRRRGLGTRLLDAMMRRAVREGARRAHLEVRASNAAAQALYEHAGFRRHAVRSRYYSHPEEDAVLMELDSLPVEQSA